MEGTTFASRVLSDRNQGLNMPMWIMKKSDIPFIAMKLAFNASKIMKMERLTLNDREWYNGNMCIKTSSMEICFQDPPLKRRS